MNVRLLTAFLATVLLASGCVIRDRDGDCGGSRCGTGNPPPTGGTERPGDVRFTWSLAGQQCARAGVDMVHITIPGESLEDGGYYPCSANGVMGVVLHDFAPGNYSYTLEALAPDNSVRYRGSGSFRVNGTVDVYKDLDPLEAVVNLAWRFPGNAAVPNNPSCSEAFVGWMALYVDDQPVQVVLDNGEVSDWIPCGWGQSQEGFSISLPTGGEHTLTVYAADDGGFVFYEYVTTLRASMGQVVAYDLPMQWYVGEGAVTWVLKSGGQTLSCSEAGVDKILVQLFGSDGNPVRPGEGDLWECGDRPVVYDYLYPDDYQVVVKGLYRGRTVFLSDVTATPLLRVESGVFTNGSNPVVVHLHEVL